MFDDINKMMNVKMKTFQQQIRVSVFVFGNI